MKALQRGAQPGAERLAPLIRKPRRAGKSGRRAAGTARPGPQRHPLPLLIQAEIRPSDVAQARHRTQAGAEGRPFPDQGTPVRFFPCPRHAAARRHSASGIGHCPHLVQQQAQPSIRQPPHRRQASRDLDRPQTRNPGRIGQGGGSRNPQQRPAPARRRARQQDHQRQGPPRPAVGRKNQAANRKTEPGVQPDRRAGCCHAQRGVAEQQGLQRTNSHHGQT